MAYIYVKTNWANLNAYVWNSTSTPSWPGVAVTDKTPENYYKVDVTGYTNGSVIFNDGTNQTDDLTISEWIGQICDITNINNPENKGVYMTTTSSIAGSKNKLNTVKGIARLLSVTAAEKVSLANKILPKNIFMKVDDGDLYISDGVTPLGELQPWKMPASRDDIDRVISETYETKQDAESANTTLRQWVTDTVNDAIVADILPKESILTISANEWSNGSVVKDIGYDDQCVIKISCPIESNVDNMIAIAVAGIYVADHTGTSITLKCINNVPTVSVRLHLAVQEPNTSSSFSGTTTFKDDIEVSSIKSSDIDEMWNI